MNNSTGRLYRPRTTQLLLPMQSAVKTGNLLDSLRRAFVANYRLLTSLDVWMVRLAKMAILALRKNAASVFGSIEIADAFLMGGY